MVTGSGILTGQFYVVSGVVKLNEEILIWFPVVVIVDGDLNESASLSVLENNGFINFFIIVTGFGLGVDSSNVNSTGESFLIQNIDSD